MVPTPALASSQKGSGNNQQNNQQGNQQGNNQGNQQNNQQNNQNQNQSPSGITGGSSPIEATMFAYAALDADADNIATAINASKSGPFIVTTSTDIPVILQWRTVLAQADSLDTRLDYARSVLQAAQTPFPQIAKLRSHPRLRSSSKACVSVARPQSNSRISKTYCKRWPALQRSIKHWRPAPST